MYRPPDRRTRVAVKGSQLGTALEALRKAIPLEDDDTARADLTTVAAVVAVARQRADTEYADIRQADARLASAALEA